MDQSRKQSRKPAEKVCVICGGPMPTAFVARVAVGVVHRGVCEAEALRKDQARLLAEILRLKKDLKKALKAPAGGGGDGAGE